MRLIGWKSLIMAAILGVASGTAGADPIVITSGTVVNNDFSNQSTFSFAGDDFAAAGTVVGSVGTQVTPGINDFSGSLFLFNYGGGFVTMNGSTFSSAIPLAITGVLNDTATPFFVPPPTLGASTWSFATPFTATGSLATTSGLHADLVGQGTLSVTGRIIDFNGIPLYGGPLIAALTFAAPPSPTPEPAPLMLLGTGLVGMILRRRFGAM
jgi:hypothetical protein